MKSMFMAAVPAALVFLVACSDIREQSVSEAQKQGASQLSAELTSEEQKLLARWVASRDNEAEKDDLTVAQAIARMRALDAAAEAALVKDVQRKQWEQELLRTAVEFRFVEKWTTGEHGNPFDPGNIHLDLEVHNKTPQVVSAVQASVEVRGQFNKLYAFDIDMDKPLNQGNPVLGTHRFTTNMFSQQHAQFFDASLEDLTFKAEVDSLRLADGTVIKRKQRPISRTSVALERDIASSCNAARATASEKEFPPGDGGVFCSCASSELVDLESMTEAGLKDMSRSFDMQKITDRFGMDAVNALIVCSEEAQRDAVGT